MPRPCHVFNRVSGIWGSSRSACSLHASGACEWGPAGASKQQQQFPGGSRPQHVKAWHLLMCSMHACGHQSCSSLPPRQRQHGVGLPKRHPPTCPGRLGRPGQVSTRQAGRESPPLAGGSRSGSPDRAGSVKGRGRTQSLCTAGRARGRRAGPRRCQRTGAAARRAVPPCC